MHASKIIQQHGHQQSDAPIDKLVTNEQHKFRDIDHREM